MEKYNLDYYAIKYKTDKASQDAPTLSAKNYVRHYEFFTEKYRGKFKNILELGVFQGASLKMWADWFPNANVYGFDIKPEIKFDNPRIKAFQVDATSKEAAKITKGISPDMIVDDAAHTMNSHKISFENLWPLLKSGGYYCIEDLHTCYARVYGGIQTHDSDIYRTCDWISDISKAVNYEKYSGKEKAAIKLKIPQIEEIDYVFSCKSLVIIKKK